MRTLGIADLEASLSETLAQVKAGEEILVTEHGRPIARILPFSSASLEASTNELVQAGVLRAPERRIDENFWRLPRPVDDDGLTLQALLDERRDNR